MTPPSPPAFRTVLFRLHWALGLTAGLVLALVGLTGALMSYEEAAIAYANRDRTTVIRGRGDALPPAVLAARIEERTPGRRVNALDLSDDPAASVLARFARDSKTGSRPDSVYADPRDGSVLGPVRLEGAFATVRALHRWLLIPGDGKGWGRTITGACALTLIVFLATGLYLRWPRIHRWRTWLRPSLSRPGRARWWSLHAVIGTWLAPVYLVIALSGLTWSYAWFKDGTTWVLVGATAPRPERVAVRKGAEDAPARIVGPPAIDRAWATFRAGEGREAGVANLTFPGPDARAIRVRWLPKGIEASSARNEARYDASTGVMLSAERSDEASLGRRMSDNMLEVHRGRFFGDVVALLFCLAALAMPAFAATGVTLYVLRRRSGRKRRERAAIDTTATTSQHATPK